ncbi:MAG: tetratricopeptide repeat protein [Proteobacteria bacterium]|jgi:tetratricopeptide (TPR) repeat protein|nr:tetratricopeptide repeat protein [Pseudomonadota bacterium]MDA1291854.1 tetratricopeptide repeat protein [Pseudomonadota bacterium]
MELTIDQALQQGLAAHNEGDLQEAERLYRVVLQFQPAHPEANHNLGLIACSTNKARSALPLFKTALDADPKVEQFWVSYIDALIKESHLNTAKAVLEQARKMGLAGEKVNALDVQLKQIAQSAPSTSSEKRQESQNARNLMPSQQQLNSLLERFQKGQFADAEASALSLTKKFPEHQFSWKVLAAIFSQTARISDAINAIQKVVQLSPQDSESRRNLSNMLREAGRFEEALASWKQAIVLNPDSAGAHCNLGMTLHELGRLEEAALSYRQAISLEPYFADAHSNLAGTLRQLGRLEEAETSCRQVIALEPDFAQGHCDLGLVLRELGRFEEAETSYRQAIALKPHLAKAYNSLGSTLRDLCRLEDAELSYRQAIALESDLAIAYSNLGVALKELGRFEEAEENYRHAIALQPGFAEARYNLGTLLFEGKQYIDAAAQFEMVDIHQSQFYAIQCAYRQNEESIFNEKLDFLINQGEVNAVIGSLSCCSEVKYGVKKPNPFCSDPLKYVVKTDLNEQYDFENIFIKTARDILSDSSVSHQAQEHLFNGIQTAGNIFTLAKVSRTEIESIIHAEIEKYLIRFKDSEEGFIKNWPASYAVAGWLVCMQSGGNLTAHMHDTGWITGSVYINVPPKSEADSGNLVLRLSDQKPVLGVENSQESSIDVKTGNLCLFPSSLHHYTVPFEEEENRIVLAFDVIPAESRGR